ncbi:hypothetical protein [Oceanobacillus massiliensis]|uniref:hypothetical protein n=1 Tax=Oceanobacillus massiliensis TaxID=1465765 RepID=UPI000309B112|nr:hypothetical protein [Oceanobacillus massiliensis]
MTLKEDKPKKEFFNLPKEDQMEFELEEEKKAEKDQAAKKVFEKIDKKYGK